MKGHKLGWYLTFVAVLAATSAGVYLLTGQEAIGAATRFIWNALALLVNGITRLASNLVMILARGVGLRRVSRVGTVLTSVGLGYAGGLILSDTRLRKAQGWRGKIKAAITVTRNRWQRLHLVWKLLTVAVLIASQIYLHFLLVVFPIAFLVPVVRRLWIRGADLMFGAWYWKTFGPLHRSIVASLKAIPGWHTVFGAGRLWRIRYLCAWRLWKYDPRYRIPGKETRVVSVVEPVRLWWRGELDRYVGRPLLAGGATLRSASWHLEASSPSASHIVPPTAAGASS